MTDLAAVQRRIEPDLRRLTMLLSRLLSLAPTEATAREPADDSGAVWDLPPGDCREPPIRSVTADQDVLDARWSGSSSHTAAVGQAACAAPADSTAHPQRWPQRERRVDPVVLPGVRVADTATPPAATPLRMVRAHLSAFAAPAEAPARLPTPLPAVKLQSPRVRQSSGGSEAAGTASPRSDKTAANKHVAPPADMRRAHSGDTAGAHLPRSGTFVPSVDLEVSWPAPRLLAAGDWRACDGETPTVADPFADTALEERLGDLLEQAALEGGIDLT